jgi:hypothetical protein
MNVSFFQTYGDRLPLLKIRSEDLIFQRFLDCFDLNIISLHNCSDNVRTYINKSPVVKNSKVFDFQGISYCQCIKNLMNFLEGKNIDRFFFYQDDTFTCEANLHNIEELKKMIMGFDYEMINLSYKTEHLIEKGKWTIEGKNVIYSSLKFNLFDTTTEDFKKSTLWSFDDSCFVCTFKRLQGIFNEIYFSFPDIWHAELYLKNKFDQETVNRYITDLSFFINYNILGRNTQEVNINNLKNNIALNNETLEMLQNYYVRSLNV